MPSPFPGMDPYLEDRAIWREVHHSLITYMRDALQPAVRPRYHVRIEERMYVAETAREIFPDVAILERPKPWREKGGAIAVAGQCDDPFTLILPSEPVAEGFLEIIDLKHGGRVVTVLEVLSHSNKTLGLEAHRLYKQKQQEVITARVNLIEIDLLRGGEYTLAPPLDALILEVGNYWHYMVNIYRAIEPDRFYVYPRTIREQLPKIFVPLAEDDKEVVLDLQAAFKRCYESGAYADLIDYHRDPPPPPLRVEDLEWLDNWLKQKKRR